MRLQYVTDLCALKHHLDRVKRIWYLSPMRLNLRCSLIQAVSQEEPSDRKPDPWPLWMTGHAQLKFVMTECSKTQIRLTRLILSQVFTKFTSTIQAFTVWSLISLLNEELGRREEKLHNHQKIQLQHFDLFSAGAATTTVLLLTSYQLAEKQFDSERHIFISMLFLLVIYRQPVTDQSLYSCNQSLNIHWLVTDRSQQTASVSLYLRLTVSDKLQINRWQVAKPIADRTLIPNMDIKVVATVLAIANQSQWNQSLNGCIAVSLSVWPMLYHGP